MKVKLTDLIAPHFHKLINPVLDRKINELVLSGGRGSIKSSFAGIIIPWAMMEDYFLRREITHCVALRKVANTCKQSIYSQIKWGINMLNVGHLWKFTVNPLKCTFKPSGQTIIFTGCDDPMKTKSIKFDTGYARYRWYEEYNQFDGLEEIRSLNFSLARGGDCLGLYTYNPDPDQEDWANLEAQGEEAQSVEGRLRHHSSFEDLPDNLKDKWLGQDFIRQVEDLKKRDPSAYKNEILGLVTGLGGNIFKNVKYKSFTDEMIATFDRIRQGLDFGFTIDPCSFVQDMYQKDKKDLSIFNEIYEYELSTRQLSEMIKDIYRHEEIVKADSAEPRTIDTMIFEHNVNVIGCEKGPDSVRHGIESLRALNNIYIDKKRCPATWREFKNYQYEKDKKGKFKKQYPGENDHSISAVRYSLDDVILNTQWRLRD